jgi:hypothetical protein
MRKAIMFDDELSPGSNDAAGGDAFAWHSSR